MEETTDFSVNLDGNVYDIKRFLRDHPGGVRTLQNYKGKSIAEGMERFGHSNSAYHMLKDFKLDSFKGNDDKVNGIKAGDGEVNNYEDNNDTMSYCRAGNGKVKNCRASNDSECRASDEKVNGSIGSDDNDNIPELQDLNLTGNVSASGRIITKEEEQQQKIKDIAFLEELENRLDWSKPLLCQLEKVAPHYETWVNSSVYRDLRLFQSPWLEGLTFTPWYVVPAFWVPVILYLAWWQLAELVFCADACGERSLTVLGYLRHVCAGGAVWTAVEYSLHRWVFHLDPGQSLVVIKLHFLIHGMHHKVPFDSLRQVFPPVPALVLAGVLYVPVHLVFSYPLVVMTGGLAGYLKRRVLFDPGYLTYDMIHYYVHHGAPAAGSYLYDMKRYHSNHHFVNHDKAFGISSKVWDHAFRTAARVKRLGFSLHW